MIKMNEREKLIQILKRVQPHLRILLIRAFKNININNQEHVIKEQTMYEFLEYVDKEAKKERIERDRRMHLETGKVEDSETGMWEIKDLLHHKQQFSEVKVKELLCNDKHELECSKRMQVQDISMICSIILNSYLKIDMPHQVKEAVLKIKDIRNKTYHPSAAPDEKWYSKCIKDICECMAVISEKYSMEPFKPPVLLHMENLKERVNQNYKPNCQHIELKYRTRDTDVHSLEDFVKNHKTYCSSKSSTIVLSGISGSGKSTVLSQMTYDLTKCDVFKLVVYVEDKERKENETVEPMDMFFAGLSSLASDMFDQNSDEWKKQLKICMKDILVILDVNAYSPNVFISGISEGNWIITTPRDFKADIGKKGINVLKIMSLDESQVKNMLTKLNPEGREYDDIMKQYDNFTCKWGLNTPEVVTVFSSVKENAAVALEVSFIQCWFEKKIKSLKGKEETVILGLGEQACNIISAKTNYVNNNFRCEEALSQTFLITENEERGRKVTRRKFCHTLLRDFLCAKYYIENPSQAFRLCNGAPFLYKRPFKIACYLAVSENRFDEFKVAMETFLSCFFRSLRSVNIDEEEKNNEVFHSWDFIFDIIEACQEEEAQKTTAKLIAKFVHVYSRWHLYCSDLRMENIQSLCSIIKMMETEKKELVTLFLYIDSSSYAIATMLWNALRNFEVFPFHLNVLFHSMCREPLYMKYTDITDEGNLKDFCQSITERCPPSLSVKVYRGPMLLSKTLQPFGNESSLRGLVMLEAHLSDILSLKKLLSCNELESLRTLDVTFDMQNSMEDVEIVSHSLPDQNDKLQFSLNVVHYKGIQKLLNKVNDIKCLTSLGILDMNIDLIGNDKIDLRDFKTLKTLELRARMNDMDKDVPFDNRTETNTIPIVGVHRIRLTENISYMERNDSDRIVAIDIDTGNTLPMDQDDDGLEWRDVWEVTFSQSIDLEDDSPSQAGTLTNVLLPENLYCLILNGFRISDLNFLCSLGEKRVIITAPNVRISDISGFLRGSLGNQVKPMQLQKDYDVIKKKKRISRVEREKLKRQPQPREREIIITQEENVNEDLSHFVKDDFHHVIRALQQCKCSFFVYKSDQVILRKDVCKDMRIRLPVKLLKDELILKHSEDPLDEFLQDLYRTLSLVQFITVEETSLSHSGTLKFAENLIMTKREMTEGGEVDPFHLSVVTCECFKKDEIMNSKLHIFVRDSQELSRFCLSCKEHCCHFCKTVDGVIWISRTKLPPIL